VADVADAIAAMTTSPINGVWNVATGRPTSIAQLLTLMQERLGTAAEIRRAPRRAGDVGRSLLNVDRIAADLGWRPTFSIEDGLATV
jgi:nucleoside-diphosphate-sugar epimerase